MHAFFLNPWMLAGLAGVLLPVLAHLLSRKRYDTVDWGAMQFLELDKNARRNLRLEDLLLLLVRMALIALLALALARPWFNGSWMGRWASTTSRDVVLVIDGSYSMGWEGRALTPHATAVNQARQFIADLRSGDTMMIYDAREQPRAALPGPTRDKQRIREALEDLPEPSGTANLFEALAKAIQTLASGTNVQREVILFTDLQALSWNPEDKTLWARLDDLISQATVPPRLWVIDAADGQLGKTSNFTIERLQLSRELAVPGVPIRISSKVQYRGGEGAITRKVYMEVNGQRLADQTLQLKLTPDGEATVDFERSFEKPGSYLLSAVLDGDSLPGDNRSDAAIVVSDSLPVLLVDGDKRLDPTRSETFFARAALSAGGAEYHWIKSTVVTPDALNGDSIRGAAVIVLANVPSLPAPTQDLLERFVASGRGLLFTLGDKVPKEGYAFDPDSQAAAIFPVHLEEMASETEKDTQGIRVAGNSLELPWLRQFRTDKGGTLTDARFTKWWKIRIDAKPVDKAVEQGTEATPHVKPALVIAKLTNGDPWLVSRSYGRGQVAVATSSLDADWNTLPAKTDYVPWLHELLFSLASTSTNRNVEVGSPLTLNIAPDLKIEDYEFIGPGNKKFPADRIEDELQPGAILSTTSLPGVYRFAKKVRNEKGPGDDFFVANFDRKESDLTPLTEEQKKELAANDRLTFAENLDELETRMFADSSRTEFWWLLVYSFLGMMCFEVYMTRRMLHGAMDQAEAAE